MIFPIFFGWHTAPRAGDGRKHTVFYWVVLGTVRRVVDDENVHSAYFDIFKPSLVMI